MTETTAANPELLQEQIASLLVQPLEAVSVVLSSGPRIFDTASPLRIPKLMSGAAGNPRLRSSAAHSSTGSVARRRSYPNPVGRCTRRWG
jgi:hypothetical protein